MAELWPGQGGPAIDYISGPPPELWQREQPRGLVILGATGSIGRNALAVVEAKPDFFRVWGLACARNVERLAAQAQRHRPPFLAVLDEAAAEELATLLPAGYRPRILVGREGYAQLAALSEASTVLSAQVGAAGLAGTLAAALAGMSSVWPTRNPWSWPVVWCATSAPAPARSSCPWIRNTTPFFNVWPDAARRSPTWCSPPRAVPFAAKARRNCARLRWSKP